MLFVSNKSLEFWIFVRLIFHQQKYSGNFAFLILAKTVHFINWFKDFMDKYMNKESYHRLIKFIYSEKATKFCEIIPLLLTVCNLHTVKSKYWEDFTKFCGLLRIYELQVGFWITKLLHWPSRLVHFCLSKFYFDSILFPKS